MCINRGRGVAPPALSRPGLREHLPQAALTWLFLSPPLTQGTCQSCGVTGPNLWACLQVTCPYVGCGESFADHSTTHAQAKKHHLTVNLTTFRVWCYACEKEVFPEQRLAARLPGPCPKFSEQVRGAAGSVWLVTC